MDDIEKRMARLGSRIQARASEVRSRLETVPGLLALCEACRETFGAKLVYLKVGDYVTGEIPEWDRWPEVLASEIGEPWEMRHEPRRR